MTKPPAINSPPYWDEVYRKELARADHRTHEAVWQAIEPLIPHSGAMVDIGCGTGAFLRWLRPQKPEALRLVGIDHSRHAIRWARHHAAEHQEAIEFAVGDAYRTFAQPGYDLVYSGHLLEHLEHPLEALDEQYRLLKRGGYVVVHFPYKDQPYVEHRHILDFPDIKGWLEKVGFEIAGQSEVFPGQPTDDAFVWGLKP